MGEKPGALFRELISETSNMVYGNFALIANNQGDLQTSQKVAGACLDRYQKSAFQYRRSPVSKPSLMR